MIKLLLRILKTSLYPPLLKILFINPKKEDKEEVEAVYALPGYPL